MVKLTETQIRKQVVQEYLDRYPDFRGEMEAYAKMLNEFGNVKPPVYIADKLEEINDIVQSRVASGNLMQ